MATRSCCMWANFDEAWPFPGQPLNPDCPTSITPFLSSQPLPPAIAAPDYINMFSRSSFRSLLCSDPYTKIRHGHRNGHRKLARNVHVSKGTFNIRDFETPRKKNLPTPVWKKPETSTLGTATRSPSKFFLVFLGPGLFPKEPSKETYAPRPFSIWVFL